MVSVLLSPSTLSPLRLLTLIQSPMRFRGGQVFPNTNTSWFPIVEDGVLKEFGFSLFLIVEDGVLKEFEMLWQLRQVL